MSQSSNSAAKTSSEQSTSRSPWFLVFVFRLLLLIVGGSSALILGIVLANIYPNPNPQKPLLPKILESLTRQTPASSPSSSPTQVLNTVQEPLQLTPSAQEQAKNRLRQLQEQQAALRESIEALEQQIIGTSSPNEATEVRLQALSRQLQLENTSDSDVPGEGSVPSPANRDSEVAYPTDKLKVTLPSDILFEENNSALRSEASLLLDKIVTDLRNYPGATIYVAVHTDALGEAQQNRELSFRRAQTVEQYFKRTLGNQYRWLIVGYGETRPLVSENTDANQQRNRRVEIAVN
ncbi:OmpA family protein [Lyngbya aestuarii]|uniref:OmpA family protein n=1 Tax=Lyngbya aestuarii TaxID=118322 RepID=UPI00403E3130